MIAAKGRRCGTTLAELLIAVVFLTVCVSGIVACVVSSRRNASYSGRRATALAAAAGVIERASADAANGNLTVGMIGPVDVAGIPAPATYTRTVDLVPGHTCLYEVTVNLTWKEHSPGSERDAGVTLATRLRSPNG